MHPIMDANVIVAKLDIASDSDSEGRGFESRRSHERGGSNPVPVYLLEFI